VHRVPFARDRRATHVTEFPALALDRMIWNKVYRRQFWDEFGYEFPAMRYEDYPVTLRAHLDAVTVDCISAPVYFWRERESGDSITQQVYEYSNLVDRVASAELVMDLVDSKAPLLQPHVHGHFVEIDLVAVLQAFLTVPAAEEALLIALGQRLLARLDPDALKRAPRFGQLQFHALASGDVEFLRNLADFRRNGGLVGGARARPRRFMPWRYENAYPGRTDRPRRAPRNLYQLRAEDFSLRTSVTAITWQDSSLSIRGSAEIRHLRMEHRSDLRIDLLGKDVRIPCDVVRFAALDSHGERGLVGFEASLDAAALAGLPDVVTSPHLHVDVTNGRFRRSGPLRGLQPGSATFPSGRWIDERQWLQPCSGGGDGRLILRRQFEPPRVTSVVLEDGAFVLTGVIGADSDHVHLALTHAPSHEIIDIDVDLITGESRSEFTARFDPSRVVHAGRALDALMPLTTRVLWLVVEGSRHALLATGLDESVSVRRRSRRVMLTRSAGNHVNVQEMSLHPSLDGASVNGCRDNPCLDMHGRLWGEDPKDFVWRRFIPGSDDHVDTSCEWRTSGDRWSAELDPVSLEAGGDPAPGLRWTLFAVVGDGESSPVVVDAFAAGRLPVEIGRGGRTFIAHPRGGVLNVVAR
jgi:CDP-glycerol glycerophosphotransferase